MIIYEYTSTNHKALTEQAQNVLTKDFSAFISLCRCLCLLLCRKQEANLTKPRDTEVSLNCSFECGAG